MQGVERRRGRTLVVEDHPDVRQMTVAGGFDVVVKPVDLDRLMRQIQRHPGPRTWVLGDLGDAAIVVDLLNVCGRRPRPGAGSRR